MRENFLTVSYAASDILIYWYLFVLISFLHYKANEYIASFISNKTVIICWILIYVEYFTDISYTLEITFTTLYTYSFY